MNSKALAIDEIKHKISQFLSSSERWWRIFQELTRVEKLKTLKVAWELRAACINVKSELKKKRAALHYSQEKKLQQLTRLTDLVQKMTKLQSCKLFLTFMQLQHQTDFEVCNS